MSSIVESDVSVAEVGAVAVAVGADGDCLTSPPVALAIKSEKSSFGLSKSPKFVDGLDDVASLPALIKSLIDIDGDEVDDSSPP
mmetsp:Transcript_7553/g.11041  ORF Transcript_7553/g.11041 Transcript_7553/m.11041 type:complete len:84 (-) Transcript_7553:280-531(-)